MSIPILGFTPHDYQEAMRLDVQTWIASEADPHNPKENRRLYASPTGTGKSIMEWLLLSNYPDAVLVTPRLGIITGMLEKIGIDSTGWGDERLAEVALTHRITTPVRFRNMLAKGVFPFRPSLVIIDEGHHDLANTYTELAAYLGDILWVALTATPFRGTPKGTAELREKWNGVTNVLTMAQAVARGCISVPVPKVWPLVDDDKITITNGEFVVAALDKAVIHSLDEIVRRCTPFTDTYYAQMGQSDPGVVTWDRPTLFACPTTVTCKELAARLNEAGLPASVVIQDTPRHERQAIFAAAMRGETAVVQIDVVSEGVDLAFRRLIDLRATMSPVKWMQQIGRTTRPVRMCDPCKAYRESGIEAEPYNCACEAAPEYYCTNRNLERHGYLFDGAIPAAYIAEAQVAFKKISKRTAARAFGRENIGRFTAAELHLSNGLIGSMYTVVSNDEYKKTEYAAIIHPALSEVLYARRESTRKGDDTFMWGKWKAIDAIPDVSGFASAPAATLTPRMAAWWQRSAEHFGLNPDESKVNKRNFAALPLLTDLRLKIRS